MAPELRGGEQAADIICESFESRDGRDGSGSCAGLYEILVDVTVHEIGPIVLNSNKMR